MKPNVCKFLVDEGADVDFCETRVDGGDLLSVLGNRTNRVNVLLIFLACPRVLQNIWSISKKIHIMWY